MRTKRRSPRAAYQRSGNILLDSILFTCAVMGASAIKHDGKVITCEYGGRTVTAEFVIYPQLAGVGSLVYFTTDMIALLQAPPIVHKPSERKSDPSAEAAQAGVGEKIAA